MSIVTYQVLALLAAHFFGDWIWQDREIAEKKAKKWPVLCKHVLRVTLALTAFALIAFPITDTLFGLIAINGVLHALIDWNGWRLYAKYNPDLPNRFINPWFWRTIAIDQFLHLAILAILFL